MTTRPQFTFARGGNAGADNAPGAAGFRGKPGRSSLFVRLRIRWHFWRMLVNARENNTHRARIHSVKVKTLEGAA